MAGCRCPECWGLAELMLELTGKDYGLPRAPGHVPFAVDVTPCDGSYTCLCDACKAERAERVWKAAA